MDDRSLELLVCPETRQPLRPADAALIARLNRDVDLGALRRRNGQRVDEPLTAGLVRRDGRVFYPIVDDIPVLLVDEAIELPIDSPKAFEDSPMSKTLFQKIIDREIPATIVYEDELCLAFEDIRPAAPVHVLLIPKKPIASVDDVAPEDEAIVGHLFTAARQIAAQLGLDGGYRMVTNCGADAGQEVMHLHFHLLGGRRLTWPPG